jgi:hypothetical protein
MSEVINLMRLEPGTKIGLSDESTAEVLSSPLDGGWVFARYLSAPRNASLVGTEEMVFAQDIVEILETPWPRVHLTGRAPEARPEATRWEPAHERRSPLAEASRSVCWATRRHVATATLAWKMRDLHTHCMLSKARQWRRSALP